MMKKDMQIWKEQYPLFDKLTGMEEVFWINPNMEIFQSGIKKSPLNEADVRDAEERLVRFAPYIAKVFPETKEKRE